MSATEQGLNFRAAQGQTMRCPLCHEFHGKNWDQRRCEQFQAIYRRMGERAERYRVRVAKVG
jgi:hypothetical protein